MKSINVKIPLSIVTKLDSEGKLSPSFLSTFIEQHVDKPIPEEPSGELTFNYTFKIKDDLHKKAKINSIEHNIAMNEFIGRLLRAHY